VLEKYKGERPKDASRLYDVNVDDRGKICKQCSQGSYDTAVAKKKKRETSPTVGKGNPSRILRRKRRAWIRQISAYSQWGSEEKETLSQD